MFSSDPGTDDELNELLDDNNNVDPRSKEHENDTGTDDEHNELLDDNNNVDPRSKEHENVLQETKKVSNYFVISSSIGFFSESMMLVTWILFAKSMHDSTDNIITLLVFLQSILQIVGILFTSYLSDKYGFDKITIYTSTILLVSAFLHSVSYSIIILGIGVALKALVMDDIEVLSLGFFGKLLPYNDAAIVTGNWYALTTITFLAGIITGGIISTYSILSNRLVFIISSIIIFFRWIYIFIHIRNTQKVLINKQLAFIGYYLDQMKQINIAIDHNQLTECQKTWFPLCLEQIRAQNETDTYTAAVSDGDNTNGIGLELVMNIIQFSFVTCFEIVTFQFIAMYMNDRFNSSMFSTQSQLAVGVVMFALVSFILPEYTSIINVDLFKKYLITFPLFIIVICVFIFAVPLTDYKHHWLYWIWWIILGVVMGVLWYINEITILELQPKLHTGKINGIKTAIRYIMVGVLSSLIVYYWNSGEEHMWFAYFQAIAYSIAALDTGTDDEHNELLDDNNNVDPRSKEHE
eukprot:181430_1